MMLDSTDFSFLFPAPCLYLSIATGPCLPAVLYPEVCLLCLTHLTYFGTGLSVDAAW